MSSNLQFLGKVLYHHGKKQFNKYGLNRKFTTSEDVFQRFVMGLLDGMVRTEILDRIKTQLFQFINEQRAVELYNTLPSEKFKEEVISIFHSIKMGGLFSWERMANGILEIVRLSKDSNGLINLYPMLMQQSNNSEKIARHKLLTSILSISGISNKKTLVLLRDLHYQCGWNYPIDDLPMPIDTHIRVVLKRMSYIKGVKESQTDLEIQSAARSYFKIPLIVDLAIWDIGKRFCPKNGEPKCKKGCPAFKYCKYSNEHF